MVSIPSSQQSPSDYNIPADEFELRRIIGCFFGSRRQPVRVEFFGIQVQFFYFEFAGIFVMFKRAFHVRSRRSFGDVLAHDRTHCAALQLTRMIVFVIVHEDKKNWVNSDPNSPRFRNRD